VLRTLLRDESNHFRVVDDPDAISDLIQHKGLLLWIDLEHPTQEELRLLEDEFHFHPLAIEDATTRHQRPKVDQYTNFYLVVFYSVEIEAASAPPPPLGWSSIQVPTASSGPNEAQTPAPTGDAPLPDDAPVDFAPKGTAIHRAEPVSRDTPIDNLTQQRTSGLTERIVLREMTMFMGANYLVTVHDNPLPELDDAAVRWRRNASMIPPAGDESHGLPGTRSLTASESGHLKSDTSTPPPEPVTQANGDKQTVDQLSGIGILLYSLLDSIVDNYFPIIDSIVERVEDLEEQIFEKFNQRSIEDIFTLKKDLLALRKVLAPERDVLNVLIRRDLPLFDEHTLVYFQDVYDHVVRITDSIDTYRDLLSSALDSYLSMQSNRLNITVQTLTSFSIMLMSIATVTGWYGMNFNNMPELTSALGYPAVFLFVIILVALEFLFFKRKGWL
jgi:Mg2+ and Co2+ transporter CorA